MTRQRRRTLIGMVVVSLALGLLALTQAFGQAPPAGGSAPTIGFNLPSGLLSLLSIAVGVAAAWAVTKEQVRQNGKDIEKLFELHDRLSVVFVSREKCDLIERSHETMLSTAEGIKAACEGIRELLKRGG